MTDLDMKNMEMLLQRYVGTVYEDFQSKLDLVAEGQLTLHQEIRDTRTELKQDIELCNFKIDTLNTKIDNVEAKLTEKIDGVAADLKATDDRLSKKIDGVAADLKAHRADTEAHSGVYQVRES